MSGIGFGFVGLSVKLSISIVENQMPKWKGKRNLTLMQRQKILDAVKAGVKKTAIAHEFGIGSSAVSQIVKRWMTRDWLFVGTRPISVRTERL